MSQTGLVSWSQTSGTNATADSNVNFSEGMAPSAVNDSARALMASAAKWRDDIAGAIVTGGTSTAYTVASYQTFSSLTVLNGQMIAFAPNATSTNAVGVDVTLNVDGLGAKPVRMQPSVALPGGTLISGTPYLAVYNNSDGVFYLHNKTNPYVIPLGGGLPFFGTTAPNSSFAFPYGQAISRTTYATLFTAFGTTFGSGDGSTTFNIPDLRGRVVAGKDDMGGSAASRLTNAGSGVTGTTLGASGGAETITMARANLPNTSVSVTITDPGHTHSYTAQNHPFSAATGGGGLTASDTGGTTGSSTTGITAAFNLNGNVTQTAMIVAQPTFVANFILRVI